MKGHFSPFQTMKVNKLFANAILFAFLQVITIHTSMESPDLDGFLPFGAM